MKKTFQLFLLLIVLSAFAFKKGEVKEFSVAFYNVENLFDTENDPDKEDDWFLPEGRNNWTSERYNKKLNDIAKVIDAMGQPTVIGLCEVESKTACEDLVSTDALKSSNYGFVHYESPDWRGIDNVLLYKKDELKDIESSIIRINFPPEVIEDYTTRDILYVKGKLHGKYLIHFFVNHWPSRRDGLKESEPRRTYIAEQLRQEVAKIKNDDPNARIIMMGDFNDEPDNNSLLNVLKASLDVKSAKKTGLYNCMADLDAAGLGTYNYRGNWNLLDQFIISKALLKKKSGLKKEETIIFREDWMMYKSDRFGETPNRTYGGPNYYGGYSDHLPIKMTFSVK
ncbi:MAG: endonuclease/exonuclease/phosphatase family protein [Bacteroidota bacterium]